jgi:hypothetical protein
MVNPAAGLVMALRSVELKRGGKKPLLLSALDNCKTAVGFNDVVPIATCATDKVLIKSTTIENFFFIVLLYYYVILLLNAC